MKIIYRILLLIIFAASTLQGFAYDLEVDGIYYNINMTERTLSVTGGNKKYTGDVVIPSKVFYANQNIPVTSIGPNAFNSSNITSIEIPNSVTEIGENAFRGSSNLASIDIPNSITEIGENAFRGCSRLLSVEIPNSVTKIEEYTFEGCSSLTSVVIPNSITEIGENAFEGCSRLLSVEIPNSVTKIVDYTFSGCSGLTSVVIPNSVTSIGWCAFHGCSSLASIEIPNSVTEFKGFTFYGCSSLTSIEIPNSVTEIGQHTFHGCSSLTSIEIPNSVTEIAGSTFKDCSSLASVDIPNSVKDISFCAFEGCSSLASIDIPNSVKYIRTWAFNGCSSLTSIEIPNSVTEIAGSTFKDCSSLVSIEIPNSVTKIGNAAFRGCSSLASVEIPNSVTEIGENAFRGCSSLKRLIFEDGMDTLNWVRNDMSYFQDSPLEEVYLGRNFNYEKSPFKANTTIKNLSLGIFTTDAMSISPQQNEGLEVINCYNPVPPEINKFTTAQYLSIIVNIPIGSLEYYMADTNWKKFWNLNEILEVNAVKIIINLDSADLEKGETLQLEAEIVPPGAQNHNVTWTSSNPEIATVSGNGLVTALNEGTTMITASYGELSAECIITVNGDDGIDTLFLDTENNISVFSLTGLLLHKGCHIEILKTLPKGVYIIVSGKQRYKILI